MADLIDRQAAIDAVQEELTKWEHAQLFNIWTTAEVRFLMVELILKQLPTAEPKTGRWIPVSERLPDREGRYLVTLPLVNGYPWLRILHYGMPDFDEEYRRRCWYETGDYCDIAVDGIIAWMPLPEPYEGRRTG